MLTMLVLSTQLVAGQVNEPAPVKLLPVWVAPAVGGFSETFAVATLALIELGRAPTSCTREGCGPFRGANFGIGLTISSIAIHVVTLVATVTLAIINAVRVGEAKKKIDVAFDGVALHF